MRCIAKKCAPKKVKLTIKRDIALQQIRKEVAEHPFGTIKWYDGAYYFLRRGKEKVAAETALSYLSYNIRRAVNLTKSKGGGVPGILMLLRQREWKSASDEGGKLAFSARYLQFFT